MKKILAFICAVIIMATSLISVCAAILFGDVYRDNKINTKDAVKLAQHIAGWGIQLTAEEEKAADVHADGKINTKDVVKIAQFVADWDVDLGGTVPSTPGGDSAGSGDIEIPAEDIWN